MTSKKIFFYNHFHNGDLFGSKYFVKSILNQLPNLKFYYLHENSKKIFLDLNLEQDNIYNFNLPVSKRFYEDEDAFYINTWIGNYLNLGLGVNWQTSYEMYKIIFEEINNKFNVNIKIKNIEDYFPEINFDLYDIPKNLNIDYENTIIFSNGPVRSGQSNIQDVDVIVDLLLNILPEKNIILTHQSNIKNNKITYTSEIIKTSDGDLNEISWVAEKCKYIIGRNSGPFCFMHTKNILNDESKKIIAFGNTLSESFVSGIKVKADYREVLDLNLEDLLTSIAQFWGENDNRV